MFNNSKKYLTIKERISLINEIQEGKYVVRHKRGKIQKKINKTLYSEHCKLIDVLEKIADIKVIGEGAYGKAYKICMPKGECNENLYTDDKIAYSIKEIKFQDAGTYNTLINNPDRYEI